MNRAPAKQGTLNDGAAEFGEGLLDASQERAYALPIMKTLTAWLCLLLVSAAYAQSPHAKVLVLNKDKGEHRLRRPVIGYPSAPSEFTLKVTPESSGSEHLVLGTETIPPGHAIPLHQHFGQDEILFLQTGEARVTLNGKDYEVHAGGMAFFPMHTWVTVKNTGAEPIQLIFIFSAPGFDQFLRCRSVPSGKPAPPMSLDDVRACARAGQVEYKELQEK